MEQVPKRILRGFEPGTLLLGEGPSCPVDIKAQHGHGRTKRLAFAPPALFGRTLERTGDAARILSRKYPFLQVKCVAGFGHVLRPSLAFACRHRFNEPPTMISCGSSSIMRFNAERNAGWLKPALEIGHLRGHRPRLQFRPLSAT